MCIRRHFRSSACAGRAPHDSGVSRHTHLGMRIKHDPSTSDISTSCPPLACDAADFRAPGGSARLDYLCIYRANFADALRHAAFVEVTRNRPTRSVGYAPTLFSFFRSSSGCAAGSSAGASPAKRTLDARGEIGWCRAGCGRMRQSALQDNANNDESNPTL
jgi:hypothetical protein